MRRRSGERRADDRPHSRHRPGHHLLPRHRVPRRQHDRGRCAAGIPADTSRSPAGSSMTRRTSGAPCSRPAARRIAKAGLAARDIAAIGITNQRETTLVWDRASGTADPQRHRLAGSPHRRRCARSSRRRATRPLIAARTGLVLDPYFSATKIAWLLDHVPGARARAERGELAFGTVDSFLLWRLTGGARSRDRCHQRLAHRCSTTSTPVRWDDELCALFGVPARDAAARCAIAPPISAPTRRTCSAARSRSAASPATSRRR